MSISGDMVASLVRNFDLEHDKARKIAAHFLETARDANFAHRYGVEWVEENCQASVAGRSVGGNDEDAYNDAMLRYWDVIQFLQNHL